MIDLGLEQSRIDITLEQAEQIEGWTPPRMLRQLYHMATAYSVVVEIGSYLGRSSLPLAKGTGENGGLLYCVDHWRGDAGAGWLNNPLRAYEMFMRNVWTYGCKNILPLFMSSLEAAALFQERSIGMIYLDGSHDYPSVQTDLSVWGPKVLSRGILCGDDYREDSVRRAVTEWASKAGWMVQSPPGLDRMFIARRTV